jgi:Zn finger protein HypA/HybF involved in hydrogenase expression/very-short-patch-repair endonuclease
MEYRGIELDESVKLYRKNGEFDKQIKKALDIFINKLEDNNHVLMSEYVKNREKVLIDFKCNHKPHLLSPNDYKYGYGCPECGKKRTAEKKKERAKLDFLKMLKENNHTLLSEYQDNHKKVLIDFKCDHEPHFIKPAKYKSGQGCPKCGYLTVAEKRSKETRNEFPSLVEANGHTLLSPYGKNNIEKVLIDFKCNHEPHWISPSMYKNQNRGCPKCGYIIGGKKLWEEGKRTFLIELEMNGHTLESEYIESHEKVLIDFKCDHKPQPMAPSMYKSGQRCPRCCNHSPEQAKEKLYKLAEEIRYKVIGEYQKSAIKIDLICDKGHLFSMTPNSFIQGQRCSRCSNRSPEQAKEKFYSEAKKDNYIVLGKYQGNKKKVEMLCDKGHHFLTIPNSFMTHGNRCPKCNVSKGERIIWNWLNENGIQFETHYRILNKRWFYDVYIPSCNLLIEVQGEQHYKPVELFHRKTSLEKRQMMDKEKKEDALSLGYKYIEVDYREGKPELALERFLEAFRQYRRNKRAEKQRVEQLSLF